MEKKKASVLLNSSSRAVNSSVTGMQHLGRNSRQKWSLRGSHMGSQNRLSSILTGGRNSKLGNPADKSGLLLAPRKRVRVIDDEGNDVAPLPLYHAETRDKTSKPGRHILDEIFSSAGSDHSKHTSSYYVPYSSSFMSSSRPTSVSTRASVNRDTDDDVHRLDMPIHPPCDFQRKRETVRQNVTEEMLDELVDVVLCETETISLLDIPNTFVSQDDDNAEAIQAENALYAELCRNRMGNDKYVVRSMQTISEAPKSKKTQSDTIDMADRGTFATIWDIYDSFCGQSQPESEPAEYKESAVTSTKAPEKGGEISSMVSTVDTGTDSNVSLLMEMELCGSGVDAEADFQQLIVSEPFKHSVLVMERSIMGNIYQPQLASYRQLPILEDRDSAVEAEPQEQSEEEDKKEEEKEKEKEEKEEGEEEEKEEEEEEVDTSPAMKHLWAFSCELTNGWNITSMAWNKDNPDLLAVGYGECDPNELTPGMICCWSLKNLTWPERVFECPSSVTSVDFSANNPSQLAVGMYDGTVSIINVQSRTKTACIASSSECAKRHLHPVWQVTWSKQEMTLSGEDQVEALVSVSADGRVSKWLLCSNGLECIDLMKLRRNKKKAPPGKKKTNTVLSMTTPGICVDFHPTDSSIYLAGTWDGLIHKCSFSNNSHFLATYDKHLCPVNHLAWSPFCPDVFLSCSSDWSIQLWRQELPSPVFSFSSVQRAVCSAQWSPNWSTVFAAINQQQVEIWDMNSSILHPTIVCHARPGARVTSLLFATGTDCVLVGDSGGQVSVYQLNNLNVGDKVDSLEDIVRSAISRKI